MYIKWFAEKPRILSKIASPCHTIAEQKVGSCQIFYSAKMKYPAQGKACALPLQYLCIVRGKATNRAMNLYQKKRVMIENYNYY